MSTRSSIGYEENGKIRAIYCHWDGYPEYNGDILLHHYKNLNKIKELIELGDISSLAPNISTNLPHSFANPQENVVVAYHRDRGEDLIPPREFNNELEYIHSSEFNWCEYFYLFKKGHWYIASRIAYINFGQDSDDFVKLTPKMCNNIKD